MGREAGPERRWFGGKDGLVIEKTGGITKYFWRCSFCGFKLGGRSLQCRRARIHLSGEASLRNGTISQLCNAAPDHIKKQFRELEINKRATATLEEGQRKRARELLHASPQPNSPANSAANKAKRSRQQTLPFIQVTSKDQVDDAWGRCFFGLDIAPNKIEHDLFKEAIAATACAQRGYKTPNRQKLFDTVLVRLFDGFIQEQKEFLRSHPGDYGRAITGDGATIMGIKFINFLVHHFGKGVMLMDIHDCTQRLQESGTIDSKYISLKMNDAIRYEF